jgi:molybdopterin synthase sulfur carrier subunit
VATSRAFIEPLNLSGAATTRRIGTAAQYPSGSVPDQRARGDERSTLGGIPDPEGRVFGMAVTIRIPTTMRPLTGGERQVTRDPGSLSDVIKALDAAHPGMGDRLLDESGDLRKFVNVFVADDDVRYLDGLATAVDDGVTVSIIPAVAGG